MNRLAKEKSPYLLQHARNPVDWFAWNEEAFDAARRQNKPIFLSVGYSTCHWCHVMERESFEDEAIGKFLGEHFISIKVDREERPDVDKIYMTFVQATTGAGGWPMSVFLTPDLKPFFGGTYFPPDNRYGRPSFLQVLQHINDLWQKRRNDIAASAEEIHSRMEESSKNSSAEDVALTEEVLKSAAAFFKNLHDPQHGGFGSAPKFPQPSIPQFLLRCAKRFRDEEAAQMVVQTCEQMAAGGIYDQLGGGFSRYSVDAEWLVPHFEKMLYDNAQLVQLYLDAYLVSKRETFAGVAREILDYILRDMTHPEGGFYSAEDADSEGQEGKFYCWTHDELSQLLSPEEFNVAAGFFGVTAEGNFMDHSHPQPLRGLNVLSVHDAHIPEADQSLLAAARTKMLGARGKRIRPHLDDKILASWNGLMLGAFARAFAVLRDEKFRVAAETNLDFVRRKLWDEEKKTLYHRWRDGERDGVELLAGYAFYLHGTLELYEATLEPAHLDFAVALAESMMGKFFDRDNGGFWQSTADSRDLILRVKDDHDGAEPGGNSVAVLALLKLGAITGQKRFTEAADKTLGAFAGRLRDFPQALPYMLQALDFQLQEPRRVVVVGKEKSQKFQELLHAAHAVYQPDKIVLGNTGAVEEFARTLPAKGEAVVYICTGTSCRPPTDDPEKIRELLD
ncbi:MAG TPA: thioredoxin domain-containing protein [Verrucomicrobiae bacterium]|jgi:hypothetical protein